MNAVFSRYRSGLIKIRIIPKHREYNREHGHEHTSYWYINMLGTCDPTSLLKQCKVGKHSREIHIGSSASANVELCCSSLPPETSTQPSSSSTSSKSSFTNSLSLPFAWLRQLTLFSLSFLIDRQSSLPRKNLFRTPRQSSSLVGA